MKKSLTGINILNKENKCASLKVDDMYKNQKCALLTMFEMQKNFQIRCGKDPDKMSFKERVDQITIHWRNMNCEMSELLERLPFKEWKNYTSDQLSGWISEEQKLETFFEYIDLIHFVMNIGIYLGLDARQIFNLYVSKNKENFARQDRNY